MQLKFISTPQFIIAEKPYGLNTHKIDDFKDGFKEFLEQKINRELGIISRLDATTSGLILFPLKDHAGALNTLWQQEATIKTYLFLTDRKPEKTSLEIKSCIEQRADRSWISDAKKTPNAFTQFNLVKTISTRFGDRYVWQAQIHTGKTHQIRLHAQEAGISILGDTKYGGSSFFRLCLHCSAIEIDGQKYTSPSPFESAESYYFPFISEFEKRSRLYSVNPDECFRWTHNEVSNVLLDQYGSHLFFYVYFGTEQTTANKQKGQTFPLIIDSIDKAQQMAEWISDYFKKSVFLKPMYDRGKAPTKNELLFWDGHAKRWHEEFPPTDWIASENDLKFRLRSHQGQSPGLFLDQRENRKWVLENSENKSVLNLFSYTSGFSVCAGVGKAKEITTVDLSKNFIEWSKENFYLNKLDVNADRQFWATDTMHFMKGAINKARKWDLIICDPPTFGRSDKGVFQIENDFELLIQNCFQCLNPLGQILFSTNFEKWSLENIHQRIRKALPESKFKYLVGKTPYQSLDFDFPNQIQKMKSVFITKIV